MSVVVVVVVVVGTKIASAPVCMSVFIVVAVVVAGTKIARSRDLRILRDVITTNPEILIYEKLSFVLLELQNMVHKLYKSCIFPSACLWFTDRTHSTGQLV